MKKACDECRVRRCREYASDTIYCSHFKPKRKWVGAMIGFLALAMLIGYLAGAKVKEQRAAVTTEINR